MAENLQLNRIQNFYSGITINDKDKTVGVCSNIEEMDIFSNLDYMEPNTIFGADATILRKITGYTLGDMNDITVAGTLYALGRDTTGTPLAQIWRKTSASSTSPADWSSVKISAYNSNAQSPIAHHRVTVDVTSITRVTTTATLTTTTAHGLTTNNIVAITVAGADQAAYNGTFKGTVTNSTTITYTVSGSPDTPATTLLAGGITVSYAFLYYVTGTQELTRAEITDSTSPADFSEAKTDLASTPNSMILSGLGAANDRIPMVRYNGELFIGHGRYVAKISSDGICTTYAFTSPAGWQAISFTPFLHNMAILARSESTGGNYSKIFYWDLANTTGAIDETILMTGGPQIVINWYESLWALCAISNQLSVYKITDKQPTLMPGMSIGNVALETDSQAVIPDATKFVNDNAFYFGLYKTDKTGLYAIGQVEPGRPYALALMKRFHNAAVTSITGSSTTATVTFTTAHGLAVNDSIIVTGATQSEYNGIFTVATVSDATHITYTMLTAATATPATGSPVITTKSYSTHVPFAATNVGGNWYASFNLGSTPTGVKGEGTSQTRSSNAIYETIWIDLGNPETPKGWEGFLIGTKVLPASCQIVVDAKVDNATNYDTNSVYSLTASNDQTDSGITADTFWLRDWTSVYGRMIRTRLRFISSTTTMATTYFLSFLSRLGVTI